MYFLKKNIYLKKSRVIYILNFILLKLILSISYVFFISPRFAYEGFVYDPNFTKIIFGSLHHYY